MYIKRIAACVLIVIVVSVSTGLIFDKLYKKRWSELFFKKTDVLVNDSTYYDIIFLGNSRAHFGINPYYVDSVTSLSSYNFAVGGSEATEMLLTTQLYLQHHAPPKMAVFSVDISDILKRDGLKNRYHYLYYLQNDTVHKFMKQSMPFASLVKALPFMKYSFFDEYNRTSLFIKGNPLPRFEHNIYKGFLNLHKNNKTSSNTLEDIDEDKVIFSDQHMANFKNIIKAFQAAGTRVVFVSPPERPGLREKLKPLFISSDSLYTILSEEFKVTYLHFENPGTVNINDFVDYVHLNEPGSKRYSIELADSLKQLISGRLPSFLQERFY